MKPRLHILLSACSEYYIVYCPALTHASLDDALLIVTPAKVGVFTPQGIADTTKSGALGFEEPPIEPFIRTAMLEKREGEYRPLGRE